MKRDDAGTAATPRIWRQPDGNAVSCEEKILVLNENLTEIQEACQEALEDAVLMDVDEAQFRAILTAIVEGLRNPYAKD
ncbi:MAG: hypothetical protein ACTSX7_17765 [Alphaproteobacteria bacterium]